MEDPNPHSGEGALNSKKAEKLRSDEESDRQRQIEYDEAQYRLREFYRILLHADRGYLNRLKDKSAEGNRKAF